MKALLLFHLKVGVRIAVISSAPLFCAVLAAIMLQMYPAALVKSLALHLFVSQPAASDVLPLAGIAFLLPAWAAPRLALGINGWIRHLGISSTGNRRGFLCALIVVQAPLMAAVAILAMVAHHHGRSVALPLIRFLVVMVAAAFSSVPSKRRFVVVPLMVCTAGLALFGNARWLLASLVLLPLADAVAGPIRELARRERWKPVASFFTFRIAWRALGWNILIGYVVPLLSLGATALFAFNNELSGAFLSGTVRFGGAMAVAFLLAGLSERLAVRRPVWPWARSFPWSSSQRVSSDALFLGIHAMPLLFPIALLSPASAFFVLALLPFLSLRSASVIRRVRQRKTGVAAFLMESFFAAAMIALLPWTAIFGVLAAFPAFIAAKQAETRQKVTRWLEMHYLAAGDPLSWSSQ